MGSTAQGSGLSLSVASKRDCITLDLTAHSVLGKELQRRRVDRRAAVHRRPLAADLFAVNKGTNISRLEQPKLRELLIEYDAPHRKPCRKHDRRPTRPARLLVAHLLEASRRAIRARVRRARGARTARGSAGFRRRRGGGGGDRAWATSASRTRTPARRPPGSATRSTRARAGPTCVRRREWEHARDGAGHEGGRARCVAVERGKGERGDDLVEEGERGELGRGGVRRVRGHLEQLEQLKIQ